MWEYKTFSDKKHSAEEIIERHSCRIVQKNGIKISTKELLSKLQVKSLKNHQNEITTVMKTKGCFAMTTSEIKASLFKKISRTIQSHIKTSQSIHLVNQLSGLHTIWASTKDIYQQTIMVHSKIYKRKIENN